MKINNQKIGFIAAILSMIVIYASSSAPIPIYSTYQTLLGITKADLSTTVVTYFIGTVISLLFFGKISDYLGRRITILITILTSIIGSSIFLFIINYPMFLLGRFFLGVSCGLASSCVAAYMVDTTPEESTKLASIVTSGSTMIGLTLGSFSSAIIIVTNETQFYITYIIMISLLIICAILVILGKETVMPKKGVLKTIKPSISLPKSIIKLIIPASAIFVSTWALGGFYQAFSSTIAIEQFGVHNAILSATIFASLMAPQILGNTFITKIDDIKAQKYGIVSYLLTAIIIIVSLKYKIVFLFLIASIMAAIEIGVVFAASMNTILSKITKTERAGVLSTIYLISYGGTAIPNFIVGQIGNYFTLIELATGYIILILVATIIVLTTTRSNEKITS